MNYVNTLMFSLLMASCITTFIGCSDDDGVKSKVLLRPVTTMTNDLNHVQLSWKPVEGATEYIIEVYRVTDGANTLYNTYTTSETSLVIDLDWDDSYQIRVKSNGNGVESAYWETDPITLVYPTILGTTRTIDDEALISWTPSDDFAIETITATPLDDSGNENGETMEFAVSSDEYRGGSIKITGLQPLTSYKICAYSGEAVLDNYQGRVILKTTEEEVLENDYSGTNIIDLNKIAHDENYFLSYDWKSISSPTTFVLASGKNYILNDIYETVPDLTQTINFVTPQTLDNYATMRLGNAFRIGDNVAIDSITFKRINIRHIKDINVTGGSSMSGSQLICTENTAYAFEVKKIVFTDCYIENFRAIVRSKNNEGHYGDIMMDNCTVNGIGNQGMFSTNNTTCRMKSITIKDCTVTNIAGIADLRQDASISQTEKVHLLNSTFCYAPMDGQFLFRTHNTIPVIIENTILGAPMKLDGNNLYLNEIGSGGKDDYNGNNVFTVINSFQTTDHVSTKGNLDLSGSGFDTNTLFQDPANNNFKLNGSFSGCQTVGANKWRVM